MHYVQRLVITIKITTKMYFCMPPELSVPFSTTYTQYIDFIFCTNLASSLKSLNAKNENFPYIPSSSGVPSKDFELLLNTHIQTDIQMQMNIFSCPPFDPEYFLIPKNSAIMIRSDMKWRISIWYLHVWGAFPSSRWYLS